MTTQCKAEVLGKLFVIPGTLCVLPNHQSIVDFVDKALIQIVPGLSSAYFCLDGTVDMTKQGTILDCSGCTNREDWQSVDAEPCFRDGASTRRVPLRTASRVYGFLCYSVHDFDDFLPYPIFNKPNAKKSVASLYKKYNLLIIITYIFLIFQAPIVVPYY